MKTRYGIFYYTPNDTAFRYLLRHDCDYATSQEALGSAYELTRDYVANVFKVVKFQVPA